MSKATFTCSSCLKIFAQKRYLKNHSTRCPASASASANKSPRISYSCSSCEKIFSKLAALKRHELIHSNVKSFQCDLCEKCFGQKCHLDRHKLTVHSSANNEDHEQRIGAHEFKCNYCQKTFPTNWQTVRHQKTMHAFADNLYKCRFCGEQFDNRRFYVNHLEYHKGLKRFSCKLCNLSFQRKTELDVHSAAKHRTGFFFFCVICDRSFSQRIQIDRHIFRTHPPVPCLTDLIPPNFIKCKYCSNTFEKQKRQTDLFEHVNENHFRKVYSEFVELSEDQEYSNFVWKTISLTIKFESVTSTVTTSRLRLGCYLPKDFALENPSFKQLEIDLMQETVFQSGEIIVIEIPVKIDLSKIQSIPNALTINYIE